MIQHMEITIVADIEDMDELEEIIAKAREVERPNRIHQCKLGSSDLPTR